jgi:hypothetical protein
MRSLLAIALLACGAPKPPPATPPVTAPPQQPVRSSGPLEHCELAKTVVERGRACDPSKPFDRMAEVIQAWSDRKQLDALDGPKRSIVEHGNAAMCAHAIEKLSQDPVGQRCRLVEPAELPGVVGFLDAYYAKRTVAKPSGDAAIDAYYQRVAALANEMCACKDDSCVDAVKVKFDAEPSPTTKPSAEVIETLHYLFDDVWRCSSKHRLESGR